VLQTYHQHHQVHHFNGGGNPNAVWIFQIGTSLTTSTSSTMLLINGAQANNIFWAVGSAATLGATSLCVGNVVAEATVSVGNGAVVNGRLISLTAAVTLIGDDIDLLLTASLSFNADLTAYTAGQVIYDEVSHSYQQVIVGGTSGSPRPAFSATVGVTTQDGSVTWVCINPALALLLVSLPPSAPNLPPAPPSAPTNPRIP
jgi:hypothetical protein